METADEYEVINKKPLKMLAKDLESKKKKTKVKSMRDGASITTPSESRVIVTTATKAELAFKAKRDKISQDRVLKKASKTHKQRVEEFNKHLDSLSEHYDIPKVSWTK